MYKRANHNELFFELFVFHLGKALGMNMAHYERGQGIIKSLDFTNSAMVNFEPAFRVSGKNVYYIVTCDEGRNIFALIYNDELDEWDMPVQITKQDKDIDYFTITDIGTSNIITLTSRDTTISEENVDDASELGYVVVNDNFDIELTHILFDNKQIAPNSDTPFTIGVKNNGTVDISEVIVSVYDDTEELVFNDTIQCTTELKSASSAFISISSIST